MDRNLLQETISGNQVDYNGHLNDQEYLHLFGAAVETFIEQIGLDSENREALNYTIYTLETHVCYLREVKQGQQVLIFSRILDSDEKRVHLFLEMNSENESLVATMELMLMGIDTGSKKPVPFPPDVDRQVKSLFERDARLPWPKHAGRTIGIHR